MSLQKKCLRETDCESHEADGSAGRPVWQATLIPTVAPVRLVVDRSIAGFPQYRATRWIVESVDRVRRWELGLKNQVEMFGLVGQTQGDSAKLMAMHRNRLAPPTRSGWSNGAFRVYAADSRDSGGWGSHVAAGPITRIESLADEPPRICHAWSSFLPSLG